ncbi:hypothetical protein GCM10009827_097130 [Dactylosporangium maewongense]|uniref:Trypsin-co-occurring domain-containing protein n=1 Tax=Dactylosporangium maewongense TaxID=634393 RepID=A0ABN2CL45_9ACTN
MRFGTTDVLVQTDEPEPVARISSTRVTADYEDTEQAILGVVKSIDGTIERMSALSVRPSQVQVQFGMNVLPNGEALVARGAGDALLTFTLTYAAADASQVKLVV